MLILPSEQQNIQILIKRNLRKIPHTKALLISDLLCFVEKHTERANLYNYQLILKVLKSPEFKDLSIKTSPQTGNIFISKTD